MNKFKTIRQSLLLKSKNINRQIKLPLRDPPLLPTNLILYLISSDPEYVSEAVYINRCKEIKDHVVVCMMM